MPASTASEKARSQGLTASIPRSCGVEGSVSSFPSSPSNPSESSHMPRWVCASISPGYTAAPPRSTAPDFSPSGSSSIRPMREIPEPSVSKKAFGRTPVSSIVYKVALIKSICAHSPFLQKAKRRPSMPPAQCQSFSLNDRVARSTVNALKKRSVRHSAFCFYFEEPRFGARRASGFFRFRSENLSSLVCLNLLIMSSNDMSLRALPVFH